jgi:hypothetical protein
VAADADVHGGAHQLRRARDGRLGPALPALPLGRLLLRRRAHRPLHLRRDWRIQTGDAFALYFQGRISTTHAGVDR